MAWRFGKGNGEVPQRQERHPRPRVQCPVCGSSVATVARTVEDVVALMSAGKPVPVVDHAPCKYSEDVTREIRRDALGPRT